MFSWLPACIFSYACSAVHFTFCTIATFNSVACTSVTCFFNKYSIQTGKPMNEWPCIGKPRACVGVSTRAWLTADSARSRGTAARHPRENFALTHISIQTTHDNWSIINKSTLSLLHRLSTWRCSHLLLSAILLAARRKIVRKEKMSEKGKEWSIRAAVDEYQGQGPYQTSLYY